MPGKSDSQKSKEIASIAFGEALEKYATAAASKKEAIIADDTIEQLIALF